MGPAAPLAGVVALARAAWGAVRAARSLTVVPADRPVFTEGPHVPASAWRRDPAPTAVASP